MTVIKTADNSNLPGIRLEKSIKYIFRSKWIYVALIPTFLFLSVFMYFPFFNAFYRSFFNWNGAKLSEFIGFGNFIHVFTEEPLFWPAVSRMLILTAADLFKALVIAFIVAMLIHHLKNQKAKYFFRILVIVPAIVPNIVNIMLWSEFLKTDGMINSLLKGIGLSQLAHSWLGDTNTVLIGLILVGFPWVNGVNVLIFLAGLLGINKELYDATKVDGVSVWQRLWKIEIPLVAPQIKILAILTLISSIQNYEGILILTAGGPGNASMVPGLILYNNAFSYNNMGYASAIGVILFLVIISLSVLNKKNEVQ